MACEKRYFNVPYTFCRFGNQLLKLSKWFVRCIGQEERYLTEHAESGDQRFEVGNFNLEDDDRSSAARKFNG